MTGDLRQSVNSNLNTAANENEYRCEMFVTYLVNRLLPYVSLWAGLLIGDFETRHYTNAIAENSFEIVKEAVCEHQIHVEAGRVIDKLYDYALSKATELELGRNTQHIKKRGEELRCKRKKR